MKRLSKLVLPVKRWSRSESDLFVKGYKQRLIGGHVAGIVREYLMEMVRLDW
uniref:Uncharacterized protein n=1 Tax=Candidatus Kentrum eta TaxID=2126337 RepID=A0A450VFE8_9GAMM|nr:MAG: hypothetical protein BECKH772A_GA0070896_100641 [Candidatus Kentron sp. H]VFJ94087.1 MAG: hypothetical protein BECKH772A_GA0070896_100661 [Candidatus Kentron sp. H]VFJ95404.1 MAG: hypothetical protein BECKH772A_GA0070896_100871 [Candidatus Kentron sp. H]VFJ98134.1 MAG: hypothetical protein BECKH772A_GA0070896_101331 [Candidatus Kentron sp. H]VFK00003.1 MAG: hypothetical protein BECKH772A_GA0070896_101787 [Candidatus Kentron sp. H]